MVANPRMHDGDDKHADRPMHTLAAMTSARDALPIGSRVVWDELASMDGTDLRHVLVRALDVYWAKRLAEESRAAYEALRATQPEAFAAYERERQELEGSLLDGLEADEGDE